VGHLEVEVEEEAEVEEELNQLNSLQPLLQLK